MTIAGELHGRNYAIQVEGNGPIKIGFTLNDAERRLSALQQASPYQLIVIGEWAGTAADERALHEALAPFRLRAEWYHPVVPVRQAIFAAVAQARHVEQPAKNALNEWLQGQRGRLVELAAALGVTHAAIKQWRLVPPERVLQVEEHTGISRHVLRPDLFGKAA